MRRAPRPALWGPGLSFRILLRGSPPPSNPTSHTPIQHLSLVYIDSGLVGQKALATWPSSPGWREIFLRLRNEIPLKVVDAGRLREEVREQVLVEKRRASKDYGTGVHTG
ncbi:hypothetical protein BDQ12DRAFT_667211 [Crucibulum laeve]|uniref:Uncharacterized protein n=1 Tax=Crucibulum laeve TaxID=68775 RepID=A0A5C3LVX0_9AGAR|nr:hypothetical protein BDQ12DRAFT_667211 [Crucibulum laeve]